VATFAFNAPWGVLSSTERLCCYKVYDQILALLPNIEEAKIVPPDILEATIQMRIDDAIKLEREKRQKSDFIWQLQIEEAKRQRSYDLFEEIICPLCYRLNPQHADMDNGKGCHYCQERADWQALKESE